MRNKNLPPQSFRFTHQHHPLTIPKATKPHKSQKPKATAITNTTTMEGTNNSSAPGTDATITFTANETKLICAIMQNLTSEIQVRQPLETFASHNSHSQRRTPN
jgi:hypothetical protein